MNSHLIYETIGYIASAFIAFSVTMKSLQKLRIINMIGGAFFIAYGLLIGALPVAILNTITFSLNAFQLWRMRSQKDYFTLMQVRPQSPYLKKFLDFYHDEILKFIPKYQFNPADNQVAVFILRNMLPVGVTIVELTGDEAQVALDFVIPGYRDFRAGKFLYDESAEFYRRLGVKRLSTAPGCERHQNYLQRIGFWARQDGKYCYELPEPRLIQEII